MGGGIGRGGIEGDDYTILSECSSEAATRPSGVINTTHRYPLHVPYDDCNQASLH